MQKYLNHIYFKLGLHSQLPGETAKCAVTSVLRQMAPQHKLL